MSLALPSQSADLLLWVGMTEDADRTKNLAALKRDLSATMRIDRDEMHRLAAKHDLSWRTVMAVAVRAGKYEVEANPESPDASPIKDASPDKKVGKPDFGLFVSMLLAGLLVFAIPAALMLAYFGVAFGLITWAALTVVFAASIAGYIKGKAGYRALVGAIVVVLVLLLARCSGLGFSGLAEPETGAAKACSDLGGRLSGDECRF